MPTARHLLIGGAIALAAFALVAFVQRKIMPIPLVGAYLPR